MIELRFKLKGEIIGDIEYEVWDETDEVFLNRIGGKDPGTEARNSLRDLDLGGGFAS
jgi:hypothetical protein